MQKNQYLSLKALINEYEKTHLNPTNKRIHMICVPVIVTATLGLLWGMSAVLWGPSMTGMNLYWFALLNLGTIGALLAGAYYLKLNRTLFAFMFVYGAGSLLLLYALHGVTGAWGVLLI